MISSCGSKTRILVYASNDIQLDESQKNIKVDDGTTHNEKILDFGSGPITLNIDGPSGKYTLQTSGPGFYIANLKLDTVVGSFQHIGADTGMVKITEDDLKKRIDSLKKLVADSNISNASQNYFIKPGSIQKITDNIKARVFGPYTTIPSGFDASTVPEIYKFYAIQEEREIIANLSKMAGSKP